MNRTSLTLLGTVLAALALAACGSSSSSSSSSAASGAAGGSATRTKLVACLKSHGVTLPARGSFSHHRPAGGGAGAPGFFGGAPGGFGGAAGGFGGARRFSANPKFQAALRACGANFPHRTFNPAARKAAIQTFVTCVRKHGFNLPEPNFTGHGSVFPAKIATKAKFRAASRSCLTDLRGAGPGSGGAGGGGTGGPPA